MGRLLGGVFLLSILVSCGGSSSNDTGSGGASGSGGKASGGTGGGAKGGSGGTGGASGGSGGASGGSGGASGGSGGATGGAAGASGGAAGASGGAAGASGGAAGASGGSGGATGGSGGATGGSGGATGGSGGATGGTGGASGGTGGASGGTGIACGGATCQAPQACVICDPLNTQNPKVCLQGFGNPCGGGGGFALRLFCDDHGDCATGERCMLTEGSVGTYGQCQSQPACATTCSCGSFLNVLCKTLADCPSCATKCEPYQQTPNGPKFPVNVCK